MLIPLPHLAQAVRASTALRLPLAHLELQSNGLDSSAGRALASALRGNARLTELNVNGNAMEPGVLVEIREAKAAVDAAWRASDEGRAAVAAGQGGAAKEGGTGRRFLRELAEIASW